MVCFACCVFFFLTSHRRPNKLITEPYQNWMDDVEALQQHSACDNHSCSMAKLSAFTYSHTSSRVNLVIADTESGQVLRNQQVLTLIVRIMRKAKHCMRLQRDDTSSHSKGNFQALLQLRTDARDEVLWNHVTSCARSATYIHQVYLRMISSSASRNTCSLRSSRNWTVNRSLFHNPVW